jgi:hypothetical protein
MHGEGGAIPWNTPERKTVHTHLLAVATVHTHLPTRANMPAHPTIPRTVATYHETRETLAIWPAIDLPA